jgi:hypothetical protein
MTCNGANVPDGLLICVCVGIVVAAALAGYVLGVVWLLMRRRAGYGWLFPLAVALAAGAVCVWQITNNLALWAALGAGPAGGKGVCTAFWSQQQVLALCAAVAIVLVAATGGRVWRDFHGRRTPTRA